MKTCNDCIHCEACISQVPRTFWDSETFYDGCKYFKDKSRFIELPCNVGDTVYVIESNEIISCTVFSIDYNAWGIPTNLYLRYSEFNGCAFIPMQCTDGFVFLTREEAEKALKEREDNDPPMANIVTKAISTGDKYWKCPPIDFNVGEGGERNESI